MNTTTHYSYFVLDHSKWPAFICSLLLPLFFSGALFARNLYNPDVKLPRQSYSSVSENGLARLEHRAGSFESTIAANGTLGGNFFGFDGGFEFSGFSGFEFPQGSHLEYLFAGVLWMGAIAGGDTVVSLATDGWIFAPGSIILSPTEPGVRVVSGVADENYETIFHDSLPPKWNIDNQPGALGVTVRQRSMVWNREPNNDFVVIEYHIANSFNADTLKEMFLGLYIDGDVDHRSTLSTDGFSDDIAGFDRENGIAYIADNDGHQVSKSADTMWSYASTRAVLGAKIIDFKHWSFDSSRAPSFNWWLSNRTAALDFGPRLAGTEEDAFRDFGGNLGTPVGDHNKYYILSHPEQDYDQIETALDHSDDGWLVTLSNSLAHDFADGFDTRYLISQGGISLAPGDSMVFVVALSIGDNFHVGPTDFADTFDVENPGAFRDRLDLSDLQRNIAAAESLYFSGYNTPIFSPPPKPILDDSLAAEPLMSWLFSRNPSVEGYDIYLAKAPDSSVFCHYALLDTPSFGVDDIVATVATDTFRLSGLEDGAWYAAGVAVHPLPDSTTRISEPVVFQYGIPHAPVWDSAKFLNEDQLLHQYVSAGPEVSLSWKAQDTDIEHYNIYRFHDSVTDASSLNVVLVSDPPFNTACRISPAGVLEEICSGLNRDSALFCLISKTEHTQLTGESRAYTDAPNVPSRFRYGVTAVDSAGSESAMSTIVLGYSYPADRDQLLVAMVDSLRTAGPNVSQTKYIFHFYRNFLASYSPDFIFQTKLRTEERRWPPSYDDVAKYQAIVIDGSSSRGLIKGTERVNENASNWLLDYTRTGGTIVDVGINFAPSKSFESPQTLVRTSFPSSVGSTTKRIGHSIFGLDSIIMVPEPYSEAPQDSLRLFYRPIGAEAAAGSGFPDLMYQHSGYYTTPQELTEGPIPYKGVMFPRADNTEVIYTWVGGRVVKSDFEGLPIGVKYSPPTHTAYILLSNPWEWAPPQVQDFFAKILGDIQTDVGDDDEIPVLPKVFALSQNYPNPFNPTTQISYSVPSRSQVTLQVYNILGQKVRTLVNEVKEAGEHVVSWDASAVASGMYFYRLSAGEVKLSRKMILLK